MFVLEAPEGRYRFKSWKLSTGLEWVTPKQDPPIIEVVVKPGKIIYVGNMHMKLNRGKNLFGITVTSDGYPLIQDKSTRDIAKFRGQYPKLATTDIGKQIPFTGIWLKEFAAKQGKGKPAN